MFKLYSDKSEIYVYQSDIVTNGSKNAFDLQIEFSEEWEGFEKTVCFRLNENEENIISVLLDESGKCYIPWELTKDFEKEVYVGVYGVKDDVVIPTIWTYLCTVEKGTNVGDEPKEATPTVYQQILELAKSCERISNKLKESAENGAFNGQDYILTNSDKLEISDIVRNEYFNDVENALDDLHTYAQSIVAGGEA